MENYKNKEWLYQQYIVNKKSCDEIAIEERRDSKTIWSWVKKFEIPTRKRGAESSGGTFKKGHKYGVDRVHTQETKDKIRNKCILDGRVPYLNKNGDHWIKGFSGKNHPTWKGGLTPERQSFYASNEWANAVKKIWLRDNFTCQRCNANQNDNKSTTFHIHHIVSFQIKELRYELSNLILLCPDCHRWVHSKKNINKQFIKTITHENK